MASYRLISDHYVNGGLLWAGSIVSEGVEIPVGWRPTLACDPQDSDGLQKFFDAGPPPGGPQGDCLYSSVKFNGNRWDGRPVAGPDRYWEIVVKDGVWVCKFMMPS